MKYLLGNEEILKAMRRLPCGEPFSSEIVKFCGTISKELMKTPRGKAYSDIVTLGFWLRKASIEALKKRFVVENGNVHLGRGVIFHVTPSNVPVNFAYSLFAGLLCGNANIVRIPSKDFPQIGIIVDAIEKALQEYLNMAAYLCLVRYGHEQEKNDYFSSICDVRAIWGGDATIAEIRKSPLPPRATEVTFADRFSLAVLDIDAYRMLDERGKGKLARDFYNDTYLTDQNACTSPKVVVWLDSLYGMKEKEDSIAEVRREFWTKLWEIVKKEYVFQDIQGVNKLTKMYLLATEEGMNVRKSTLVKEADNRLVCVEVDKMTKNMMDYFDNAGYFLEHVTADILDLPALCDDSRCQTIGYVGKKEMIMPLVKAGLKGVDRGVPIGKTMDFDLIWDGYNLYERLTRIITL